MKLSVLLLFVALLNTVATPVNGQNEFFKINMKNVIVRDVLKEVEKKTGYRFFFSDNFADIYKTISINVESDDVTELLSKIFQKSTVTYKILENNIVVITPVKTEQQGITIIGAVTDKDGPLPGVNVMVKGTLVGMVTDANGKYTINVPNRDAVLVFSFVGYQTKEYPVGDETTINIAMDEDTKQLEEVVVIGYGSRSKKDLTGAVSQIKSEDITRQVSLSPEFAMQGKMAGVMVSNPGSNPIARPTIRIRGVSTLGYNDPLYVVDGVPLTEGGASSSATRTQDLRSNVNIFSMINPNDIESISVLKDASATAIYGVRASNGVILVTTKRGSEGKPRVDLSLNYGIQNIFKRYDVVSMQEYVDMSLEAINANTSYAKEYWYTMFDKNSPNYMGNSPDHSKDWMDAALVKNAAIQDYNISLSGGGKISTYAVGAGYTNQNDALYKDSFDRYSFFLNSDHKITNWLKFGESYRYVYSKFDDRATPSFSSVSLVIPWQPLYDSSRPDGLAVPGRTIDGTFRGYGYGPASINNFLGSDEHVVSKRELMRNLGTFYAEVSPLQGLRFRGTFSFDYYTNNQDQYQEPDRGFFEVAKGTAYAGEGNTYRLRQNENINIVKEFLIAYANKFGDHSVDLVLNAMSQDVKWNINQEAVERNSPIPSWDQHYINEGWPSADKTLTYERYSSGLIGYMGRLSYNYAQKYYLDATVRRDGTSKFGPGYKWGTFPSFAGAWRISAERFMEDISWLNDLKIRGGWGQSGNQETREYAFLSMVNMNPKAAFGNDAIVGDGVINSAAALGDFPIKDMSWETVTTYSIGFDLVALKNRVNFTAEYYSRNTDGILQSIVIPWTIGALNSPVVNLAKVNNRGFEFQVGYNDRFGEIGVNATANLTTVRNRVSDLYRNQPTTSGNERIEDGYSMNYIYGYKTAGIFQTDAEVSDYKAKTNDVGYVTQKAPGDVHFVDLNGAPTSEDPKGALKHYEPDGKIDDYDRTYLGKTIPGYYYGITLGADYKNWDLVLGFRGVGDVQKVNSLGLTSIGGGGQRFITDYRDRWTPTNHSNIVPRAIQSDPSGNNRVSSRFVQNAEFFRFQNFQIGYRFKGDLLSKIGISNLRCYISGSNLFVISPYNDLDPEDITTPTVFSIGANISF